MGYPDFRPSFPVDDGNLNGCNCYDNYGYDNYSSSYPGYKRGRGFFSSPFVDSIDNRDGCRSPFDSGARDCYRSPFGDLNRSDDSYRSPFSSGDFNRAGYDAPFRSPFNDSSRTDDAYWSPFSDYNRTEADTYRSPFSYLSRSDDSYRSPFEDRARIDDDAYPGPYDAFDFDEDAYTVPFNGFKSEDVYRSPSVGCAPDYYDRMPSSSWRSHLLPSCSVAELQEIADGVSGFTLPTEPANEVYPRVYLGDAPTALSTYRLNQLGITHVVNVAQAPTIAIYPPNQAGQMNTKWQDWGTVGGFVRTTEAYYKHVGMKFLGIPAYDTITFNLSRYFYEAADFIDSGLRSGGRVLVHCHAGISRSATVVAAFLMIKRNMTAQEAIRVIRSQRSIRPNSGFLQQLCDLNETLLGERRRARADLATNAIAVN